IKVQRAPVLPPPDFVDAAADIPPAQMGYDSLADWVDAHTDAPDAPVSGQPTGSIQREEAPSAPPIAPDFSLQTGDYNQADFDQSLAAYYGDDENDTRPIDVQRAFHDDPDFGAYRDYQSDYPVDDTEYAGYGDPAAPEADTSWSGDVSTPPSDAIQRDYEAYDTGIDEVEQGYIEPADARPFFETSETPDHEADTGWGRVESTQAPVDTIQRDYESETAQAMPVEDEADPADTLIFDAPSYEDAGYAPAPTVDENPYLADELSALQGSAWGGDVQTSSVESGQPVQRDYEAPDAETGYGQAAYEEAPAPDANAVWGGDVDVAPPTDEDQYTEDDQQAAPDAHTEWGGDVYDAPAAEVSQRDYQPGDDQTYVDDESADAAWGGNVYDAPTDEAGYAADAATPEGDAGGESTPEWGWQAAPPSDQSSYDAPSDAPTDAVQRDYQPPTPDAGYDVPSEPPVDLYQAMMGAGMVPPDESAPQTGWGDADVPPGFVQRAPDMDADAGVYPASQPVDLYQAMMQTGMVQPEPDDPLTGTYYPPEPDTSMSAATKADLLSLLDSPAPHSSRQTPSDFTPDVSQPPTAPNTVSRSYQPPAAPPVIQRAE
ncbi:MAG: hypothetical protein K8I30_02025, partial [Anaerolineae bacterium]|nr:hypothetical protein [Anaerolineae bacterium]